MIKLISRASLVALFLIAAAAAQAANDPIHAILQRLSANLTNQARTTYSYAMQTLNPVYPGTLNVINALDSYTREAQRLETVLNDPAVTDFAIRAQVSTLALGSQRVAFAINALGMNPALNGLIQRWNQTVNVLNQIKAYVPTGRDAVRTAAFARLHGR